MIAVTSAMIVPSLDLTGASIEDESEKLTATLRYAMEEAQFSGQPLRWVATRHGWHFEVLISDKQQQDQGVDALSSTLPTTAYIAPDYTWEIYEEPPLQTYHLPAPLIIQAVEQAIAFDLGVEVKSKAQGKEKDPVLGQVLFLPDGTTSLSDIILASEDETVKSMVLRVRPGPAGIHLKKEGKH